MDSLTKVTVRPETHADISAIYNVHQIAFDRTEEAELVNALRTSGAELISLIAVVDHTIVGHVLFSPVTIEHEGGIIQGMGLAPLAVLPEYQRRGIGSQLAMAGLSQLLVQGCPYCVVLGHPSYYPRFGFEPASKHGISCQFADQTSDSFMIIIFDENALKGVKGLVRYRPEFASF